ncbi:unannotated protein [freshwater metagenome]|uniref:Unannotated protein n=1 Tax=freshwater metagenome TaxID=449393 RepID=A0A6J6H0U5_9ZZZZ
MNLLTEEVGFRKIEHMFESVGQGSRREPRQEPISSNFTDDSTARRLAQSAAELTDDQLVDRSRELAGTLSAAEAELASVLAEVEIRRLHTKWECGSVEFFASWHCQLGRRRARSIAALGRALHELPVLAEAVTEGRLSVSKAEPIIRVATPETEAALVDLAVHATVGQVQRICSTWRRIEAAELAEASAPEPASIGRVIVIRDEDGIELRARFDHVHGELVLASLETATAAVRAERAHAAALDGAPPATLDRSQWRAEALLRLCETAPVSTPPTLQPSGFTAQLVVHVPVDTLIDPADITDTDSTGAAADVLEPAGVAIRRDAARWLACDAGLLTVLEDGNGDPLHLGRRTITITPQQRRAVHARHRTCAWPGCTATLVQIHHRHHRAFGGHDDVENLVPECRYHHGLVHRRNILVTADSDGTIHHWRPDGSEILANPSALDPPGVTALEASNDLRERQRRNGIDVEDRRRLPQWFGDSMRMMDAIDAIVQRQNAARRRTRPTGPPADATAKVLARV